MKDNKVKSFRFIKTMGGVTHDIYNVIVDVFKEIMLP